MEFTGRMEIRDTCVPRARQRRSKKGQEGKRERRKKKGATWYVRVGRSRRTYRIGNAVEDIKSSSTICQSPLMGSFHLVLLFHLHFLLQRRNFARDVPHTKRRHDTPGGSPLSDRFVLYRWTPIFDPASAFSLRYFLENTEFMETWQSDQETVQYVQE